MNKYNLKSNTDKYPIAYDKHNKEVVYCKFDEIYSIKLKDLLLSQNQKLEEIYSAQTISKKYTYSRASILNSKIPLIVLLSYNEGLLNILKKSKIEYDIVEEAKCK